MVEHWTAPTELPDLSKAGLISLDIETRDENLQERGCGGVRKDGYIVGVSIATDTGIRGYFPIRHQGGGNLDPDTVLRWLRDSLRGPQPKIGANIIYDLEWLRAEGVTCGGPKWDVQVAEALIDEDRFKYGLDILAREYTGRGKDEALLLDAGRNLGISDKEIKANIWRLHAKFVGPYGTADADLPLEIFKQQRKKLEEEELVKVFDLESSLIDVLLDMRFTGIPVDLPRAEQSVKLMKEHEDSIQKTLNSEVGFNVDVWSADSLERICIEKGFKYNLTEKNNPSFEAEWLAQHPSQIMQAVGKIRKLNRGGGVFIQSKIIEASHNGKIYPTFRQTKDDDGGTRSGRLASANPNMQQVPARDKEIARIVRSCFVAEPGCRWGVFDWSQQEPRFTVHYAHLQGYKGADEAVRRYNEDPNTDYHSWVAEMAKIDRKLAKDMNLGLAYGMGKAKMAAKLGRSMAETSEIYDVYHNAVPFMKLLGTRCMEVAKERGYIKTIYGRRRHYNLYGPPKWSKGLVPKKKKDALVEFGPPVIRYFCHNAMNALVQGSSADALKVAMVELRKIGYVMPLNIHDELDYPSIQSDKQIREIKEVMEHCMKISVPMKVDVEVGPNWGECEEVAV